jgi:hypothetical protein
LSQQVSELIKQLCSLVSELEALYPGRHFTPDGHLVGSIGECLVAEEYDLTLIPTLYKGFDANDTRVGLSIVELANLQN